MAHKEDIRQVSTGWATVSEESDNGATSATTDSLRLRLAALSLALRYLSSEPSVATWRLRSTYLRRAPWLMRASLTL